MIAVIDNYDSFVYNLVHYIESLDRKVSVFRNDQCSVEEIAALAPEAIVISPGPGTPDTAGVCVDLIKECMNFIPILGVCLGHQCLAAACGGTVVRAAEIIHGKVSRIHHDNRSLFRSIENPFPATRYHSLLIERESLPSVLEVTAWTEKDEIMAVQHSSCPSMGVQFHPESILTASGKRIISNFLKKNY